MDLPTTPQEITLWALEHSGNQISFRARYLNSRGRGRVVSDYLAIALRDFDKWLNMMRRDHSILCQTRPGYTNARLYIGEVYVLTYEAHHEE